MNLQNLGYNNQIEQNRKGNNLDSFGIARVIAEHKERYVVSTGEKEYEAEIIGNLRFTAQGRADFPAVGDWVAVSEYDQDKVLIHAILPRKSIIERAAVNKFGEKQIIATNIDFALMVQAVDRDFNLNRIERYLSICYNSKVQPIIVLSKTDLIDEAKKTELLSQIKSRTEDVPVYIISNLSMEGIDQLIPAFIKGKTYCLLGSSGVGKSSLTNILLGEEHMKTAHISDTTNKGRHVTSHRELLVIQNGALLIDNPGMREVGIADASGGLEKTFDAIIDAAQKCRFKDCTHTSEAGCAVLELVESGDIDAEMYENFMKMEREKNLFEMSAHDRRKKDKDFGKMFKNFKSDIQKLNSKHKGRYRK
jgi:ribosome biogenesis GTPase